MLSIAVLLSQSVTEESTPATQTSASLPTRIGRTGVEASVPIIDIAPLLKVRRNTVDNAEFKRVAEEIVAAGRPGAAGFFTIVNHGIDQREIQLAAREFFRWPMADKMQLAPALYNSNSTHRFRGYAPPTANGKEILDSTNPSYRTRPPSNDSERAYLEEPTRCSSSRPEHCAALDAYWGAMQALGGKLLSAVATGLGEVDSDFFGGAFRAGGEPMSCLRFNRYPLFSNVTAPAVATAVRRMPSRLRSRQCSLSRVPLFLPDPRTCTQPSTRTRAR